MKERVFINASLSSEHARRLNAEIAAIVRTRYQGVFLPQHELPPGEKFSNSHILRSNLIALSTCDLVLSVLDSPGSGVTLEIGAALVLRKPICAFRSEFGSDLGKMLEGVWEELPGNQKASSLEELRHMIDHLESPQPLRILQ